MKISDLTVIASLITAIAAIVAPVITALIQSRTSVQMRKLDLLESGLRATVSQFTDNYSIMRDGGSVVTYRKFIASGYELITMVTDSSIQNSILEIMKTVREPNHASSHETDKMMDELMRKIAKFTSCK